MSRITIHCKHEEPCDTILYSRAYMAKRQKDSVAPAERMENGTIAYKLRLTSLPTWLVKLLGTSLEYSETVTWLDGHLAVDALSPVGNVQVHMAIAPAGGHTVVTCVVELDSHYRGMPLPKSLLRALVRNRFRHERQRDAAFVQLLATNEEFEGPLGPEGVAPAQSS